MVKNHRLSFRLSKERKDRFLMKCRQLGISEIKLMEKICDEPLIFLEGKFKLKAEWVATV